MRTTVLTTARLRLTTWESTDLPDLADLQSDPEVMTYLGDGRAESLQKVQRRLRGYVHAQVEPGWTKWRVEDRFGHMIGRAGFGPFGNGRELGYVLARDRWGQGLATELARGLVDWDHDHPLTPPQPLCAFAVYDNAASRRVLEKVGFTLVDERLHGRRLHAFYVMSS